MTSDPEQIRGQITQTQRNLSTDVDALSEKRRGEFRAGRGPAAH